MNNKTTDVVIKLDYPFEFEGEQIDSITLRRAKYKEVKHSRTLKESEILDYFLTTLSERPLDLIDDLDPQDIVKMDKVIMDFLGIAVS